MNNKYLTAAQLRRLADIKDAIAALESEFNTIATTGTPVSMPGSEGSWTPARRRKFARTIANRNSIIQPVGFDKKKRRMSNSTRAKLSAMMSHRWKKAHAAGKLHL